MSAVQMREVWLDAATENPPGGYVKWCDEAVQLWLKEHGFDFRYPISQSEHPGKIGVCYRQKIRAPK